MEDSTTTTTTIFDETSTTTTTTEVPESTTTTTTVDESTTTTTTQAPEDTTTTVAPQEEVVNETVNETVNESVHPQDANPFYGAVPGGPTTSPTLNDVAQTQEERFADARSTALENHHQDRAQSGQPSEEESSEEQVS